MNLREALPKIKEIINGKGISTLLYARMLYVDLHFTFLQDLGIYNNPIKFP